MSDRFIGVDEAGRGPVLGSLFVAGVAVNDRDVLPAGVDDSKALAAADRESLATQLADHSDIDTAVVEISAAEIDAATGQLNQLTANAAARVIDTLRTESADIDCVVDACDTDADRYAATVRSQLSSTIPVTAAHRADETDTLVGAASIVAKSEREAHVALLAEQYGAVGSGYPSDPTTRSFLHEWYTDNGRFPEQTRESWGTCEDIIAAASQNSLSDFC